MKSKSFRTEATTIPIEKSEPAKLSDLVRLAWDEVPDESGQLLFGQLEQILPLMEPVVE